MEHVAAGRSRKPAALLWKLSACESIIFVYSSSFLFARVFLFSSVYPSQSRKKASERNIRKICMNNLCCWLVVESVEEAKGRQKWRNIEKETLQRIEVKPAWLQQKPDLSYLTFSKTFLCSAGCFSCSRLKTPTYQYDLISASRGIKNRFASVDCRSQPVLIFRKAAAEKYSLVLMQNENCFYFSDFIA